jgi:Fe-Mn family superoxide dismutase
MTKISRRNALGSIALGAAAAAAPVEAVAQATAPVAPPFPAAMRPNLWALTPPS